jgi:hypothetical protein
MGANLRTFAVRQADQDEVRHALVSWLGAKGFELYEEKRLFPFDAETERGAVLSETPDWAILAFSHAYEEGDRLVFELNKLRKPLLEIWVFDSDIWGYRLHDSGQLVASFNSNPRYFGGPEELELPKNGDPELLRTVCELPVDAGQIAALQRQRAVFSESVSERFCIGIGAEAAAYDYQDFEELRLAPGKHDTAGGVSVDCMFFVRRSASRQTSAPRLHDIALRAPAAPRVDPEMVEWQAQIQRQMLPLTIALRGLMWGARAVSWIFGPLFLLWWRWKGPQQMRRGGLLAELQAFGVDSDVQRHGQRLVNRRHGCSFELPESAELLPDFGPSAVFRFRTEDVHVHCDAVRPSRLREQLRIWPGAEILEDEKHFAGELPARSVLLRFSAGDQTRQLSWHLVQTPQAVYRFHVTGEEISENVRKQMRAAAESFRVEQPAQ